eukprot:543833-Amphidinium_carterae.1
MLEEPVRSPGELCLIYDYSTYVKAMFEPSYGRGVRLLPIGQSEGEELFKSFYDPGVMVTETHLLNSLAMVTFSGPTFCRRCSWCCMTGWREEKEEEDVREVLGLTGVPGQNGWKAKPKLPQNWPPPQLQEGNQEVSGKTKPKGESQRRSQRREEQRDKEVRQESWEDRAPEEGRRPFKLVPAQDVVRETRSEARETKARPRGRSTAKRGKIPQAAQEKKSQGQQAQRGTKSTRTAPRYRGESQPTEKLRRSAKRSESPPRKRRHSAPSSSSSLDRLLKNIETSSEDDLGKQLREVKKANRKFHEGQRRQPAESSRREMSGSSTDAPNIFKSLRKA